MIFGQAPIYISTDDNLINKIKEEKGNKEAKEDFKDTVCNNLFTKILDQNAFLKSKIQAPSHNKMNLKEEMNVNNENENVVEEKILHDLDSRIQVTNYAE